MSRKSVKADNPYLSKAENDQQSPIGPPPRKGTADRVSAVVPLPSVVTGVKTPMPGWTERLRAPSGLTHDRLLDLPVKPRWSPDASSPSADYYRSTMAKRTNLPPRVRAILLVLNGAGALIATGFAGAGLARPSIADPRSASETNVVTRFWAASSAIRTWAVAVPLLASLPTQRGPSPHIITAAGIVQLGDAALGLRQRNILMTLAPAVMGAIHLVTARALLTEADATS
ncbi:MAG: hypothetical protein ACRYG2_21915 [Janthinobacterium lividum]